jgi:hypothetical protein
MIRELAPPMPSKAPWIPEPALSFGQPGVHFMPVPAFTGAWSDQYTCGHTCVDIWMAMRVAMLVKHMCPGQAGDTVASGGPSRFCSSACGQQKLFGRMLWQLCLRLFAEVDCECLACVLQSAQLCCSREAGRW